MSTREPNNSQLRDDLLAKLLAESLASPSSATGAACPDAETISAYAERSLAPEETARLDVHFADCVRCQTILAAFARSLEAVPAVGTDESPEAALPTLANIPPLNMKRSSAAWPSAAEPARASEIRPAIKIAPFPQPTRWRELAPAWGIAAAVALWFALRPVPPTQNLTAQLRTDAETSATQAAVPPAAPNDSQIAGAYVPIPPEPLAATSTHTATAAPSLRESQQLSANALKNDASLDDASKRTEPADKASDEAVSAATSAASGTLSAAAAPQSEFQTGQAQATPSAPVAAARDSATRQTFSAELRAPLGAAAPKAGSPQPAEPEPGGAPSPAAPPPNAERAKSAVAIDRLTAPATATVTVTGELPAASVTVTGGLPAVSAQVFTFASPSRAVSWRVGAGGNIERSTDRGQTWEKQGSGVSSDLTAGTASSNEVAWIVGRAGVVLRSTDGVHWQRVSPPLRTAQTAPAVATASSPAITSPATASTATVPSQAKSSTAPSAAPSRAQLDLVSVTALDALHATVISGTGRRFITSDGGQTWTAQ